MSYKPASIPNLPPTTDPALRNFLSSIKEALEVRLRQRGNALDAAPTFRDLLDAGILNLKEGVSIGGKNYTTDQLLGLVEFTLPNWITSDTAPPAPTGLAVSPYNTIVKLTWDASQFDQYEKTEIWRSTTNNLSTASRIGSTTGSTYTDSLPIAGSSYYYWIRDVSRGGIVGPFNDINGAGTVAGASAPTVSWAISGEDFVLSWPTPVSNITIQFYLIEYQSGSNWFTKDTVGGNVYRSKVNWSGSLTFRVRAIDIQNNYGLPGAATVQVSAPSQPLASYTFSGENVIISWSKPATGTLPIASYRVYEGSVSQPNLRVDQLSTAFQAKVLWTSKTYVITAIDSAGNQGAAATVNVSVAPPVSAQLTPEIVGEYVRFNFDSTKGSLPIVYYDFRFGTTYATAVPLEIVTGSATSVRAEWSGLRRFWVAAVDTSENESPAVSVDVTVSAASAPSVSHSFAGVTAVIEWNAVRGTLPTSAYEVRYGASYSAGTFVAKISGTSISVPVEWVGSRVFWVAAIDTFGNSGAAGQTDVLVSTPSAPVPSYAFSGPNVVFNWSPSASSLPIVEYEIRYGGASYAAATSLGRVKGTTFSTRANWSGERTFWIAGIDQNLNTGSAGQIGVTINVAPKPTVTIEVIDNNVLLRWNEVRGTLPTETYELRRGATYQTAAVIGSKSGAFTTVFETSSGKYTYWITAIDTAGNFGLPASATATVAEPPDYLLAVNYVSSYSGTKINAIIDSGDLVIPVNTTQTWTTHFTSKGWDQPQDQIDAGYPLFIQPGAISGSYEESWDYGTTLAAMKITVDYTLNILAGAVTDVVTITTALDAGFTNGVQSIQGKQAFMVNFRYIKVRIDITSTDDKGVSRIEDLTVKLDAKLKSDAGTSIIVAGGAHPQGSVSQDYLSLWMPGMTMPPTGFTLNGTANENKIVSIAGPSGLPEPVWACVDFDVANDGDGGWNTTYAPANCSSGHLFAVFMRTRSNAGSSYWGTSQNSTILNIAAGTANTNPYFWSGDLPALDTWYLVVGYVHPIGYGTTVTTYSGVYDLAGTKLAAGTDYKFAAGATSLMHRAYHYYNTTGTTNDVQYMARPVVIPCAESEIAQTIQYILTCGVGLGATATLNTQFVDITSITVAGQLGVTPKISIYDFEDGPYPKRFNIFNYTSAGVLTDGVVSWTARGY